MLKNEALINLFNELNSKNHVSILISDNTQINLFEQKYHSFSDKLFYNVAKRTFCCVKKEIKRNV